MDDRQALAIVSALANGANPQTGELFPADSPYQAPEVIRALFAAQRALEVRTQPGSHPTSTVQAQPTSSPTENATKRSGSGSNAGKPWSGDEDKQLLAAFDAGQPLADIARQHGRTVNGVRARLEKHGRLEPSPATRWPASVKESSAAYSHSNGRG
jgi:hypothetical protein